MGKNDLTTKNITQTINTLREICYNTKRNAEKNYTFDKESTSKYINYIREVITNPDFKVIANLVQFSKIGEHLASINEILQLIREALDTRIDYDGPHDYTKKTIAQKFHDLILAINETENAYLSSPSKPDEISSMRDEINQLKKQINKLEEQVAKNNTSVESKNTNQPNYIRSNKLF